jgi:pentatricopeptide repeat protein
MISGYAKSGKADDARAVFDAMKERDVATWNVMIGVYAGARRPAVQTQWISSRLCWRVEQA